MGEPPLLVAAVYPTVTDPSPALIDATWGADGSPAKTVTTRETVLAAANVESPGCEAFKVQLPTERNVMSPVLVRAQTELPEVMDIVTASPLELETSGMNPG
jgi:hypothetical protein